MIRNKQKGFTLLLGAVLAVMFLIIASAGSRLITINSHQSVYLSALRRTHRLAETGMNKAMGNLIVNPGIMPTDGSCYVGPWVRFPSELTEPEEGFYQNEICRRNVPIPNGYYVKTSARRTEKDRVYESKLHTYMEVSNVADYLAAIASELRINDGTDAANGKIYSPKLVFNGSARVKSANFVAPDSNCTPLPSTINPAVIEITDAPNLPVPLAFPLLFPQVLDEDLERYQIYARLNDADATNDHNQCDFDFPVETDIYPPGYEPSQIPGDNAFAPRNWVANNADHVYYCPGIITIGNVRINGQILFVSPNTINITGNIRKAAPGGLPGGSTAHEAVLITRSNVTIANTYYDPTGPEKQVQTIEAMILAPHGKFSADVYANAAVVDDLKLAFNGSLVLALSPEMGTTFNDTSGGTPARQYSYDEDLRNEPPPYMPALTNIMASIEETVQSAGMFAPNP